MVFVVDCWISASFSRGIGYVPDVPYHLPVFTVYISHTGEFTIELFLEVIGNTMRKIKDALLPYYSF